jgi:hypothetical protein
MGWFRNYRYWDGLQLFFLPLNSRFLDMEGQKLSEKTALHTTIHLGPLHTRRLRACGHYISSTLIGGKGGAGPSSLRHTTIKGPTEYVNATWCNVCLHGFLCGIKWIMFRGHLDYLKHHLLEVRRDTKPLEDLGTPNAHNHHLFYFIMCEDPHE